MAWKATGQPTVRKQRDKWVVRVDGIDTATGQHRPRQLGTYASQRSANIAARSMKAGDGANDRGTVSWLVRVDQLPTRWLFPARRADQHITALCNRLRRLGIEPRATRLAASPSSPARSHPRSSPAPLASTPAPPPNGPPLPAETGPPTQAANPPPRYAHEHVCYHHMYGTG